MTKMIKKSLIILAAAGLMLAVAAAQSSSPTTPAPTQAPTQAAGPGVNDPGHPRVNQVDNRLENQNDRIQQGVKNGTLSPQEARRLRRNDQRVLNQERRDMAAHGGHLTGQEQRQLNRELNKNSKNIYKEKHGQ